MRIIVFFDLPVKETRERRVAAQFRNYLLKDGFYMLQYSVYCRICAGYDTVFKHRQRLRCNLPSKGSVRLLTITEKQYEAMEFLVGKPKPNDAKVEGHQISFF